MNQSLVSNCEENHTKIKTTRKKKEFELLMIFENINNFIH